jgi:hypothetical protein
MIIGKPLRTLYIEPIEEPAPAEASVPVELAPDPLPAATSELDPA